MEKVRVAFVAIGAILATFIDSIPLMVWVLVGLMAADVVTGLLAAYINQELSSNRTFRGIAKKTTILILVAVAAIVQTQALGVPLTEVVAGSFAVHELLSVLENAAKAGVQVPESLRNALLKVGPK